MYYLSCLSLLCIFRYEGITYGNKRNQENKNGPRVREIIGYLKKGIAGHRCYTKGTGKMVGTLIGERVEWTNRKRDRGKRDDTNIVSKRPQRIMFTIFFCLCNFK